MVSKAFSYSNLGLYEKELPLYYTIPSFNDPAKGGFVNILGTSIVSFSQNVFPSYQKQISVFELHLLFWLQLLLMSASVRFCCVVKD